ncbi:prenyltransferase/squalene oxidase repeat-containing protein [Amycolatopsis sp. NPDC049868]|uniref:prenyltransferase/squalene oxidase repeat-containing protein n=1 Tax=Amycolatopsis sp. NPDC049868 TaxID=3363934 RepID=UPI00379F6430
MSRIAVEAAVEHLLALQHHDGRWEGEMVWNTMLLSQYVLTHRMLRAWPLSDEDASAIRRHYEATRLTDGSWPSHSDGPGSVYITTLAYVTLRVMGVPPDDPLISTARSWLHARPEGVLGIPTWGRIWLAMLGLYGYEGVAPVPPELILLPRRFPLHPHQLYCHTRYVYLGLAYLYGQRTRFDLPPSFVGQLRDELYDRPYDEIDFAGARGRSAGPDVVVAPNPVLRVVQRALAHYEDRHVTRLRRLALRRCAAGLRRELAASGGHGLSPVNALLACLVMAADGSDEVSVHAALRQVDVWRWQDKAEGLRIVGARSSAWDTTFAMRALLSAPASPTVTSALARAYRWLCDAQETGELPEATRDGRDAVLGGWCFSDGAHRWPVADCTAEALSAVLLTHDRHDLLDMIGHRLPTDRLIEAVEFILRRQNGDGGFSTYERRRAPTGVEMVNPSEMFINCMTDRSHVECTASCVAALARFAGRHPGHAQRRISTAIRRGVAFIRSRQLKDGSYPAAWGIHFTYSSFFVVEALTTAGVDRTDQAVAGALTWLSAHQKRDGGWGEHHSSCLTGTYVEHPESQAAMTAWSLLALVRHGASEAVDRGMERLITMQDPATGGWRDEAASGVFFGSAVLDYRLYKDIFPLWALAEASRWDGKAEISRSVISQRTEPRGDRR